MNTNTFHLLKTSRFLPLFITQFFGAFNDNVFKNAMAILMVYRLANTVHMNSETLVMLAGAIFIIPFFLFSSLAGQLADKYEKSRLIAIIKLIEIILMLIAACSFYTANLYLMFFVLWMLGMHSTFFGPLKYAILPDQLHENELVAGNGLIEAGTFLAILIGTMIGSGFILHMHGTLLISSLLLLVALGGWISSFYIPVSSNYNSTIKINFNILHGTWRLMVYATQRKDIFLSILGISWFWLFGSVFLLALPVFVKDSLHAGATIVTLFLTLFSVGLGIGAILCNKLVKGKVDTRYVPLGVLGVSIFTIDLYFASHYPFASINGWRLSLDLLLMAICGGIYTVPLYGLMQQRSELSHRSRVIASNNILNALFMVMGALAATALGKMGLSVSQILLAMAIVNLLVAIGLSFRR